MLALVTTVALVSYLIFPAVFFAAVTCGGAGADSCMTVEDEAFFWAIAEGAAKVLVRVVYAGGAADAGVPSAPADSAAPEEPAQASGRAAAPDRKAAGTGHHENGSEALSPEEVRIAEARIAAELERIEARLEEQEQSFRHVLTMLIEWLEEDPSREAA
jgi:hypothetical protein